MPFTIAACQSRIREWERWAARIEEAAAPLVRDLKDVEGKPEDSAVYVTVKDLRQLKKALGGKP